MGLMDILQQYAGANVTDRADASGHFDQVAQHAPADVLAQGLANAFRSDRTPAIGEMVGQLFGQSSPEQKAGMLQELLRAVPQIAGSGMLGQMLNVPPGASPQSASVQEVTPAQAKQVSPEAVQSAVDKAAQHEPSIVDTLSQFYAQHPGLVRTLGSAALTIALSHMSQRMQQR